VLELIKVFSSNIIFKAPRLFNSSRRGELDRFVMVDRDEIRREQVGEEDRIVAAIPKHKAEELLEAIRNGMDKDMEVICRHHQEEPLQIQQSKYN
jgi:hypothetical protein